MQNELFKGQLSLIVNIENYTLRDVLEHGHKAMAACNPAVHPGACNGSRAGGMSISGLTINNATTAMLMERNSLGRDVVNPPVAVPSFEGTGLAVYSLHNFSFTGGVVGAQVDESLGEDVFMHGRISGFGINVNCSVGVDCAPLTHSLAPPYTLRRLTVPCGCDTSPLVSTALEDVTANTSFWVFGHAFATADTSGESGTTTFIVRQLSSGQEQQADILSLIVNTTDCSASALLVLPTFRTSGPSIGPYSLVVKTTAGASAATMIGAPTVDWASPFVGVTNSLHTPTTSEPHSTDCQAAVYGRNLAVLANPTIQLKHLPPFAGATVTVATCDVLTRTESRACFVCKGTVVPGQYSVALCGDLSGGRHCTNGRSTTQIITDTHGQQRNYQRRVINASQAPYSLDPSGKTDVTEGLRQALVDATMDGKQPGGLVVLGPGTFLLDPHAQPSLLLDNCAICRLAGRTHRVHLTGAGMNSTTLLVGPNTDAAFAAAQVGLEDLTLADTPAANGRINGFAVNGTSIRALWTMTKLTVISPGAKTPASATDSAGMATYEGSDLTFRRVRFLTHRVGCGLALRYMKRVQVDNCVFIGGNINVWGPVLDVKITNNVGFMNCDGAGRGSQNVYNSSGLGCGGFIDALGWGGAGHASDITIVNNSVWHLLPKAQSRFPGRFFVGQNYFLQRLFIAGNTNHMAGPGALSDQNKGEQVLLEVTDADSSCRVAASIGTQLTLIADTASAVLAAYRNRVGLANDGSTSPLGWRYFKGIGTVHISSGRGVGQWRTITTIHANDTIELDTPFTVSPDSSSSIVLAGASAHSIIVRDNHFDGAWAKEHVTDAPHVATTAVFLWGNTHRYTAANNVAHWIRYTLDLFSFGNSSQADILIKGTKSTGATRTLLQMNFPLASGITGLVVRNLHAEQAYSAAMSLSPHGTPSAAGVLSNRSGHGAGIVFEDLEVNATPVGISMGSEPHRAPLDGTLLQAVVRNSWFRGSARTIETTGVWHNLTRAVGLQFDGVQLTNFRHTLAGTQPVASSVHIVSLRKHQKPGRVPNDVLYHGRAWALEVENMGLGPTNVTVRGLPTGIKVVALSAQLAALGGGYTFELEAAGANAPSGCGRVCASDTSGCLQIFFKTDDAKATAVASGQCKPYIHWLSQGVEAGETLMVDGWCFGTNATLLLDGKLKVGVAEGIGVGSGYSLARTLMSDPLPTALPSGTAYRAASGSTTNNNYTAAETGGG